MFLWFSALGGEGGRIKDGFEFVRGGGERGGDKKVEKEESESGGGGGGGFSFGFEV